jgi:ABC-type transport system involved in multi-copper enzyme maturation permease subunit
MASTVDSSRLDNMMMPYVAIWRHDLRTLLQSKLVRLWLAVTVLLTLFVLAGNWNKLPDAVLIASLLFPYLVFPWFLVVIMLGVTPVSGAQAESLADGILSRPVTRHGYLLATWAARVVCVLGVYLVVMVPAILLITLADRPAVEDNVTIYGIVTTLGVVGLVLTLVVSLGFLGGTLLRKPLLAAIVLIFAWYPVNFVLSVFSLEELSPISLNQAATTLLRSDWHGDEVKSGEGTNAKDAQALSQQATHFLSVLSGTQAPQQPQPGFFDEDKFDDFSLWRVVVGYSVPTVAAIGLAVFCFYRRDL